MTTLSEIKQGKTMKLLKFLTGLLYAAVPIVGWYYLYRSFKQVKPGEISVVNTWNKSTKLEAGIYFHPFPWETYGANFSKADSYIDLGALKVVRIFPGQKGVKMTINKQYEYLEPGIHDIDMSAGDFFDPATGIQNIGDAKYTLGDDVKFTITEGQVAVLNTINGIEIYNEAKQHTLKKSEGSSLIDILNISSQVLELPALTVMCSDQINMRAHAMLTYKVTDPIKTVNLGMGTIIEFLKQLGDGALRTILSRYSSDDVAPSLHDDEGHNSQQRIAKLQLVHDQFVKELGEKTQEWGITVSDLLITEILPADLSYKQTIQNIGTQRATAEAKKKLAKAEADVAIITAEAEQSKIVAAKKEQEEAIIRAETEKRIIVLSAEAMAEQLKLESEAKALAIKCVGSAESNVLEMLNRATADATETTKMLAEYKAQGEIFKNVDQPVYIPQPIIGHMRVYSGANGGRHTVFSNSTVPDSSHVQDVVGLQTVALMASQSTQ